MTVGTTLSLLPPVDCCLQALKTDRTDRRLTWHKKTFGKFGFFFPYLEVARGFQQHPRICPCQWRAASPHHDGVRKSHYQC
jgi:hypothetical protein